MIEFFVSKFWAFLVSMVILGVLVQGMQISSLTDRNEALNGMAEDLETLFEEFAAAGTGLETTMRFDRTLPSTAILTLFDGYGVLEDGDREVRFVLPAYVLRTQSEQGVSLEVDSLVIGPNDTLLLKNLAEGSTMTKLSR